VSAEIAVRYRELKTPEGGAVGRRIILTRYGQIAENAHEMNRAKTWLVAAIAACFTFLAVATVPAAAAQASTPITEKIEWTWSDRPEVAVAGLPNVLLIGDSITRGYYPEVSASLKGVANVYLFATSACSGDPRLPEQVRGYFKMMGLPFAVVHFNNGMHGWGYTEQQYAAGLPEMLAALKAGVPNARLIWATTTPVRKETLPSGASNARIDARNKLAAATMSREHIATDDQHQLMLQHSDLHSDDVHYTAAGSTLQAEQVAAQIRPFLPKP
ncbi:MAG TPA: SGNH/GDSL hydrolase family protein, partial [Chloroflexota bacterium]|nr:SGNH/GDSL hydrolase family protein [Chloroflexota bacterium]